MTNREAVPSPPPTPSHSMSSPSASSTRSARTVSANLSSYSETEEIMEMDQEHVSDNESGFVDDKRKRNAEASRRYRQRKKLRERSVEEQVSNAQAKIHKLEGRVNELESQVRLLMAALNSKPAPIPSPTPSLQHPMPTHHVSHHLPPLREVLQKTRGKSISVASLCDTQLPPSPKPEEMEHCYGTAASHGARPPVQTSAAVVGRSPSVAPGPLDVLLNAIELERRGC